MGERISIVYSVNEGYFSMIFLSALSIVRKSSVPVTFYIVTMDLRDLKETFCPVTEEQRAVMEEVIRQYGDHHVVLLDATALYRERLLHGKNHKNSYTPYAQGRLLLDGFDLPPHVVYLDSDIMCCGDVRDLLDVDIDAYEFAAVVDVMGKFWIARDYCNSGVMLMNMERMKETKLLLNACLLLQRKRMSFPDQSALNKLVQAKKVLPRRFNEQREIRPDTLFKHFCQGIKWLPFFKVYNYKQTQVKKVHKLKIHDFDDIYEQYRELAIHYGLKPLEE